MSEHPFLLAVESEGLLQHYSALSRSCSTTEEAE